MAKAEMTGKQSFYLFCGYFCSLLACIGVYFWIVLFWMQSNNAPYLVYEMQHIEGMSTDEEKSKIATMKWSFLIVSIVSLRLLFTYLLVIS